MNQLLFILSLLLLLIASSGCIVSEVTEYKITLNDDLRSGTFTTIMRNVESDSQDSSTQQKDFRALIDKWKSDQYLLDQLEKGLYVKMRSVRLEKGKLVWRESAIFANLGTMIPDYNPDRPLKFPLSDTSGQRLTTNGTLTMVKDSLFILWPPHTKIFEMKTVQRSFTPRSSFADLFKPGAGR